MRQFVKFIIVGASSTVIDLGLHALLYKGIDGAMNDAIRDFVFRLLPSLSETSFDPAYTVFKALTFICATFNGFYWNRRWTFRIAGKEDRHRQLGRFYVVYIIGLLINTTVATQIYHRGEGKWIYLLSLAVATVVTTGWTFPANKFWTFKVNSEAGK